MTEDIQLNYMLQRKQMWPKWTPISQCSKEMLKQANLREMWANEIVLDDDNGQEKEITVQLEKEGFSYLKFKTGSKGHHFHVFFDELFDKTETERKAIRKAFIQRYNCDIAKQSGVIAYEFRPHFKTGNKKELVNGDIEIILKNKNKLPNLDIVKSDFEVGKNILCPFHDDHEPSLHINEDRTYHCFGCGKHGSLEELNNIGENNSEIITLKDLLDRGVPKVNWRINHLIPERGIVILGGEGGSCKSWLAMDMALSIANGEDFLDKFYTEQATVLYLDEENGDVDIPNRFSQLIKGQNREIPENLHIKIFSGMQLDTPQGIEHLSELIKKSGAEIIILDSLIRFMAGDENKSIDAKKVFDGLKKMFNRFGNICFVIMHHTVKNGNGGINSIRGSGDYINMCNYLTMLKRTAQGFKAEMLRGRGLAQDDWPKFEVKLESNQGDSVKLVYSGEINETTKKRDCIEFIKEFIEANKLKSFTMGKNSDLTKIMYSQDYNKTTQYDAINALIDLGEIKNGDKRGTYNVVYEKVSLYQTNLEEDSKNALSLI
jgi:archaellum biogenesis ATPase FlaH